MIRGSNLCDSLNTLSASRWWQTESRVIKVLLVRIPAVNLIILTRLCLCVCLFYGINLNNAAVSLLGSD